MILKRKVMMETDNDCVKACIASLTGIRIRDIPEMRNQFQSKVMRSFLFSSGIGMFWIDWHNPEPIPHIDCPDDHLIIIGESPRNIEDNLYRKLHAVVGIYHEMSWKILHDPHPDNLGFKGGQTDVIFLYPIVKSE